MRPVLMILIVCLVATTLSWRRRWVRRRWVRRAVRFVRTGLQIIRFVGKEDVESSLAGDGQMTDEEIVRQLEEELEKSAWEMERRAEEGGIDQCLEALEKKMIMYDEDATVYTTKGSFECKKIVITAGGWLNGVLGTIGVHLPVTVTQEQVTYLGTPHMKDFTIDKYPVWYYHLPTTDIYGLPIYGNSGTKIGIDARGSVVTANTRTFDPDPEREKVCIDLVKDICPKFDGPLLYSKTCIFTMPPDRNFVIDTCAYKGWSDVIVCCGAGHAFKFSCLLGTVLSEMAVEGRTRYDISQFSITRDEIQNPNTKTTFHMGSEVEAKL